MNALRFAAVLSVAAWAAGPIHAQEAGACSLDRGLQLMDSPAPDEGALRNLLARCDAARAAGAPEDFRLPLLHGLLERRAGRPAAAVPRLEQARAMAPQDPLPALELALTYERLRRFDDADALYAQVLAADAGSNAALLGRARVARARGRLADARAHYEAAARLQPTAVDARAGLAFVDLEDKRFAQAASGFQAVLADAPAHPDAVAGMAQLDRAFRHTVEVAAGHRDLAAGNVNQAAVSVATAIDASDTVEIGLSRNSRELAALRTLDPTPLPRSTVRLGYRHASVAGLGFNAEYEFLDRRAGGDEQRAGASVNGPLPGNARWFAGGRKGFSGPFRPGLAYAGATLPFAGRFEATATAYYVREDRAGSFGAASVQVGYHAGDRAFYSIGVARVPELDIWSTFARLQMPVARMQELVLGIEHRSRGSETELMLGWRFHFK